MANCFDSLRKKKPEPVNPPSGWYHEIAAAVGWYWTPRTKGPQDWPMDVDFGERHLRPKRGNDYFPVPGVQLLAMGGAAFMGMCNNKMPMNDVAMIAIAMKKRATTGPYLYSDPYVGSFTAIPLAGAPKLA